MIKLRIKCTWHRCQEFKRIKYLKIARHAFPEPIIPGMRKPHAFALARPAGKDGR